MTIRELLQIELWSKRTTRKIFVGLAIVFGTVLVAGGSLFAVEFYWLTPTERKVAQPALAHIDELEKFDPESAEFASRTNQAQGEVDAALRVTKTIRDQRVANALGCYLLMFQMETDDAKMRRLMQQRYPQRVIADREQDKASATQSINVRAFLRSILHKALD